MSPFLGNKNRQYDPISHVQLTMLFAILLQLLLPDRFVLGSRYLLIGIEVILLLALMVTTPKKPIFRSISRRSQWLRPRNSRQQAAANGAHQQRS